MSDLGDAAAIENDPASQALIAKQQADFAESQKAGDSEQGPTYPREFSPHTRWVDDNVTPTHEFVGTQYSYDTKAEALARIDAARADGKYAMVMDADSGAYVLEEGAGDWRITIED